MLSFIFSFNTKRKTWWDSLLVAVLIFIVVVSAFELYLGNRGYKPWISDSAALWGSQRESVNWVTKPIVLVGASRIQLNTDIGELQQLSGKRVIQLAIDGQDGGPVLESIANASSFSGTVIVSLQESTLARSYQPKGTVLKWIQNYEQNHNGTIAPNIEAMLQARFQIFSNYHSIEMENVELFERIVADVPVSLYLKTTVKRDRYADYRLVKQPDFYVNRVIRHLGYRPENFSPQDISEFNQEMLVEISGLDSSPTTYLDENIERLVELSNKIEGLGGKVIFIRMPTDKLIYAIDKHRFPKDVFWGAVLKASLNSLHFSEIEGIKEFYLPDGSRMDQSQKARFTRLLFSELNRRSWL